MEPPRRPRGRARASLHEVNQPNRQNEPRQQIPGPQRQVPRLQGPRPISVPPRPQVPWRRNVESSNHQQNVKNILLNYNYGILTIYIILFIRFNKFPLPWRIQQLVKFYLLIKLQT